MTHQVFQDQKNKPKLIGYVAFFVLSIFLNIINITNQSIVFGQQLPIHSGVVLWLDANDISTLTVLSGDVVSEWRDKSGSGNHASQGVIGEQPIVINLGRQNSLNLVRFDGLNDWFSNNTLTGYLKELTMYGVYQGSVGLSSGSNARVLKIGNDNVNDVYIGTNSNTWINPRASAGVRYNGNTFVLIQGRGGSPLLTTLRLIEYYNSGTNLQNLSVNISQTRSNTGSTSGFPGANNYTISKYSVNTFFSGDIAELIVFNRVLTSQERNLITDYLNAKRLLYGSESLITGQGTGIYQSGQLITYTLQYTTRGPDNASGTVSTVLPASMVAMSSNPTRSSSSNNTITWSGVSMLTGTTGSIILTAQIISGSVENIYSITGTISGTSIDSDTSNNTVIISGKTLYPSSDLRINITSSTGVVRGGEYVGYIVEYANSGSNTIENISIQLTLLSGLVYNSSSVIPNTSGLNEFGDKTLYRNIITLGANSTGSILITGQVIQPFRTDPMMNGLRLWYDPSTGLVFSGSNIVQRSNKISDTGHIVQYGAGLSPSISGSSINGKATVYFSGTSFMTGFQIIQPGAIGTVFMPSVIVGQKSYASVISIRPSPICYPSLGANYAYIFNYNPTLKFRHTITDGSIVQAWINGNVSNNQSHSNIVKFDTTVIGFTGTVNTGRSISLGNDFCAGYGEDRRIQGYIGDVLIYDGFDQTTSKMASVNRYLNWKYFMLGSNEYTPQLIASSSITGDNTEINISNNTINTIIEYQASADLGINSSTNNTTYNPSTNIVWTINYYNSGRDGSAGISITHQRQTGIRFISSSLSGVSSTTGIVFTNIQAEKNQTGSIIITGLLNTGLTITGISRTGTISGPLEDKVSSNNTSTGRISVNTTDLSINKSVSGSVISGGILTYILSYANNSVYTVSGVNIIDSLSVGLSGLSTSILPTSYANNTYTWSIASLGPNQTGQIILTAQIITGIVGTNLSNTASIGNTIWGDNNTTNNISIVNTILAGTTDLLINISPNKSIVPQGDTVTYTLSYNNSGSSNTTGIRLSFEWQSGFSFGSTSLSGSMSGTNRYIWTGISLNTNQSGLLTITLTGNIGLTGSVVYNWSGTISSNMFDSNVSNNTSTGQTTLSPVPDLRISQTTNTGAFYSGSLIVYTINYGNSGNQTATGVLISQNLTGIQNLNLSPSSSRSGNNNRERDIVALSPGKTGRIIITGTVSGLISGSSINNTAVIRQDGGLRFDGVDDYIQTNLSLDISQDNTFSIRYNPKSNTNQRILTNYRNTNDSNGGFIIAPSSYSGKYSLFFGIYSPTIGQDNCFVYTEIPENEITHITIIKKTQNRNNREIYINGQKKTVSTRGSVDIVQGTVIGNPIRIGYQDTFPGWLKAILYDTKIFNRALSSGEVQELYLAQGGSIPSSASGNVAVDRRFNDMSGKILSDRGPNNITGSLINYTNPDTTLGASNKRVDILGNPLTSIASYEQNTNNNTATGSISVTPSKDFSITKTANTGFVQVGDQIGYTIAFSGRGPDTGNVSILDNLSPGLRYLTSSLIPNSSGSSSTGSWFNFAVGNIGSGQSGSLILSAIVLSGILQPLVNTATISSDILDPITGNNTSSVEISGLTTNILITNIISTGGVYGGESIGYQIQYLNSGNTIASQTMISAILLSGVTFESASPTVSSTGTNASGDTVLYRNLGTVGPFQTGSVFFTGRIIKRFDGGLQVISEVFTDSFDNNPNDNTGYISQQYIDNSDMRISISYTGFLSGLTQIHRYLITTTNSGREDNASFNTSFTWSSGFVISQATGGGLSGSSLYQWTGGSLYRDASRQHTIDLVKSGSLASSILYRTGTVSSPQNDANLSNNIVTGSNDDAYAGTGDLSITKTASTGAVYINDIFSYTLSYYNSGDTLFDVLITDTLANGLTFISSSIIPSSTGTNASGNTIVTWSGLTIPGNSSGVIILTAQVITGAISILPTDGLQLWIDAADVSSIAFSSSKITAINDKSGKGRHATQATQSAMPLYVNISGKSYMSFSGTQRLLNAAFTGVNTKNAATKFMHLITGNQTTLCGGSCPNMIAFGIGGINLHDQIISAGYSTRINASQYSISRANLPNTNNYIISTRYRGINGIDIKINNTLLFTNSSSQSAINGIGYQIGHTYGRTSSNNRRQGQIGEVILYDRALSDEEISQVESYLGYKRKNEQIMLERGVFNTVAISGSYDPNTGNNNSSVLIDYLPSSSLIITGTPMAITGITAYQEISHTFYRSNSGPDDSGPINLRIDRSTGYVLNTSSITGTITSTGGIRTLPSMGSGQTGALTITGRIISSINPEQTPQIIFTGEIIPSIVDFDTSDNIIYGSIQLAPSTIFIKAQTQNRAGGNQTTTGKVGIYIDTQLITGGIVPLSSAGISQLINTLSGTYTIIIEGESSLSIAKENIALSPGYINIDFTTGLLAGGFVVSDFYGYFARDGDVVKGANTTAGRNYINSLDLEALLNQFKPGTSFDPLYDLNKDNKINSSDITILIGNYYESGYGRPLEFEF